MKEQFNENAVDTLSTLVSALGAGIGVWGTIHLLEAYEREANFEQLTEEHRSRLYEIGVLTERLYTDRAPGKISKARFEKLSVQYEAEETELRADIAELKADIAAQKKQGIEQILAAGQIYGLSFMVGNADTMSVFIEATNERHRQNQAET